MTLSLETRDLTIRFGGHVAVDRVSCTFRPGELTAIVGPNGAGKTTYFNLISGQLRRAPARCCSTARDITRLSAPLRTRAGLGRAFQLTNLFPNLSVEENVRLAVQAERGVHYDMLRPWMLRTRPDRARRRDPRRGRARARSARIAAAALSHGDQRKLEVALMIALEPKVFMFDEPTAGMSVDEVPVVLDLIARLKQDPSKIILLVEHKMDVVRSLADRIIVLNNGPGRRRRAGGGDRLAGRAGGLSRRRAEEKARDMSDALLTLSGVHTHIGRYHILQGVDFSVPPGPHHHAARPQRRGQDDDAAHHHGAVAGLARRDPLRRRAASRRCRRRTSRTPASAMCRRPWRSSPTSR